MSVLIKNMEMPQSCSRCDLIMSCPVWQRKWIKYENKMWYLENRDVCCPLEEVEE